MIADSVHRSLAQALYLVNPFDSVRLTADSLTPCSVVIPVLALGGLNAYNLWNEHWEHWEHLPPLEERVEYPYQNIRTKNFFWGDGDKVSTLPKFLTWTMADVYL